MQAYPKGAKVDEILFSEFVINCERLISVL